MSTSDSTNPYSHPLEPSFVNTEPQDEFTKEIADWIAYVSQGRKDIEVEAKFGLLKDKQSGERIRLGVLTETGTLPFIRWRYSLIDE